MSATRGAWPLVGRDGELAEIAAARADPECPAVLISAPAGVGKSRLAREAFAAAEADGARTMCAQATASSATIPLGALAPVIPVELRSGEPLELVLGATEAIRARAGDGTVMLGVDDAQLLDDASAALSLNLATSAGVFVLMTVRSDVRAPDAIDSLWKDSGARRIDLTPVAGLAHGASRPLPGRGPLAGRVRGPARAPRHIRPSDLRRRAQGRDRRLYRGSRRRARCARGS